MVRTALVGLAALALGFGLGTAQPAALASVARSTVGAAGVVSPQPETPTYYVYKSRSDNLTSLLDAITNTDVGQGWEVYQLYPPAQVGTPNTWVAVLRKLQ